MIGFDAALGDPLGDMRVSSEAFAHMTKMIMNVTSKVLLVLEGVCVCVCVCMCVCVVVVVCVFLYMRL